MRLIWTIVIVAWSAFTSSSAIAAEPADAFLAKLLPMLRSSGKTGRVNYIANCPESLFEPVPFPRVKMQSPTAHGTDVCTFGQIFARDESVVVMERKPNIIIVTIGKIPSRLLATEIHTLKLDPVQRYNARNAIDALQKTKEVQSVMKALGVRAIPIAPGLIAPSEERLPHLPASLKNITVDQALDLIAKTFNGVVLYGSCAEGNGQRFFWMDFAGI